MAVNLDGVPITLERFWEIWERHGDGWDIDLSEPDENTIRVTLGGELVLEAQVTKVTVRSTEYLEE